MATIHVNRGATSLGAFPEEQVRDAIRAGRFLGTDLGWKEGMANWQPLSQFAEFAQDFPSGAATAPPPQVPAAPAVVAAGSTTAAAVIPRSGLPWDQRHSKGFFSAFIETLQMVLTRPGDAFTAMQREGGLGEPLMYALIGGSFGYLFYMLFLFFMPSLAMMGGNRRGAFAGMFGMGAGLIFAIIFVPIALTIVIFLASAIWHICLMIVGGAKQPFETTFRVVCFSIGSTYPLMIVPLCGGFVAAIWNLVLHCIGFARAHETDTGRAVIAVFLPLVLCCGLWIVCVMIFGGLGAMMQHSNP